MGRRPGPRFEDRNEPMVRNKPVGAVLERSKKAGQKLGGSLLSL